jgi:hypothetical protein
MMPRKYNNPPPARSEGPSASVRDSSAQPSVLNPADEVEILVAPRLPRLWLRVAFAVAPGTDPARAALVTAAFVGRTCALDKRLRLSVDPAKSSANGDELVLTFALGRWGTLEAKWLEEVKPAVREEAAGLKEAELKSVEVVSE